MAPEFKPGTFEPVLTVSQRGDGLTRAFHGDRKGLTDVCATSFRVAYSTSVGQEQIWSVFGEHAPTDNGSVLDSKHINKSIRRITEGLRQAIDEIFNSMALVPLPKYEQGSLVQMS